jgi:RNA polymerase sigma-70 factor (ECF subfamily)
LAETPDVTQRSNEEWLADLQGPGREAALADLRALLQRGLTYALSGRSGVDEGIIEDFCQDALIKILDNLNSFRGESRFTTWAQKIAVNTAFTELRRRRWQNVSLNGIVAEKDGDWSPHFLTDRTFGPEQRATQEILLNTVKRLINQELTDRQRRALTAAVFQQVPLDEIARRMDTNRNALYKLLYDARKRLKERMLEEGLSPDEVLAAFEKQ